MRRARSGWWLVLLALGTTAVAARPRDAPPRAAKTSAKATNAEDAKAEDAKAKETITKDAVNAAAFAPETGPAKQQTKRDKRRARPVPPSPLLVKVQILLDRARFSPGAIDGRDGDNLRGALRAYAAAQGLPAADRVDEALFERLRATSTEPVIADYTITADDLKGSFEPIPARLEEQAAPRSMDYTTAREMLAERFHMQRELLSALNPGRAFDQAGTVIAVAAVPPTGRGPVEGQPLAPKVARVEVDKSTRRVQAFGEDGRLVATYPASIGSSEKPAPTGRFKVTRVAFDPWYTYNPKYRFKGVKTRRKFSIQPGPNNPVGLVWIDLSIPSYGIHGTPEPENIGKTESHGCIRLTNWDARDLASHVQKGAVAEFLDK